MNRDELPDLVQRFFADYLVGQRNLSAHTREGYRDAFRLFLAFLSARHRRAVDQLTLDTVNPESVLAFLDHLERARGNATRTRNLRPAAIRTFVRFVLGRRAGVDFIAIGHPMNGALLCRAALGPFLLIVRYRRGNPTDSPKRPPFGVFHSCLGEPKTANGVNSWAPFLRTYGRNALEISD